MLPILFLYANPSPSPSPWMLQAKKLNAPTLQLPLEVKKAYAGQTLIFVYKICTAVDGRVSQVTPIRTLPEADQALRAQMVSWLYQPLPQPVCFAEKVIFKIAK